MINNILRLFLYLLLTSYVSCAVGSQEMTEEYIVKINTIEMYRSAAENIFRHIADSTNVRAYDAKNKHTVVSIVGKNMDVVIEDDLMEMVSKLYQECLREEDVNGVRNDWMRKKACTNGVCVNFRIDKNDKVVVSLIIFKSGMRPRAPQA